MVRAFAVKEAVKYDILRLLGVHGIGISKDGLGEHIVVYVLSHQVQVPDLIGNIRVVKLVTGRPKLLSQFATQFSTSILNQQKWRPYPAGVSIGAYDATKGGWETGTLGLIVYDTRGPLILSCNHIMAGSTSDIDPVPAAGSHEIQPGTGDFGSDPADLIATLDRWVPYSFQTGRNTVDAALARISNPPDLSPNNILFIGGYGKIALPHVGQAVKKSGRTTQLTFGTITDTSATFNMGPVTINGASYDFIWDDQIVIPNPGFTGNDPGSFAGAGDSGSLVLDQQSHELLGMVFAGTYIEGGIENPVVLANKMTNVQSALGFSTAPTALPRPGNGGWIGGVILAAGAVIASAVFVTRSNNQHLTN